MSKIDKAIIRVIDLYKSYDKNTVKAVDGVSFEVLEGEIFALLGPNGAGKTTTVEIIEGIHKKDKGEVFIGDFNIDNNMQDIKHIIGVTLQSNNFFPYLTLIELLNLFGHFYDLNINAVEYLEKVELMDKKDTYFTELSGGQKQRFAVALALINDPKILFLDEPTTGLDPQSRRHLWSIIENLKKEGKTIFLTTHFMDEAETLADRVAIMDSGHILVINTPRVLIDNLIKTGFSKKIVSDNRANLEDVFINMTGKHLRE
ncbi:ABC transporter ATP-binding protein [Patescibacteria group bacterium]|nr:ABC transporter ATP-binding protein [Patescibacteria group bacterium]